LDRFGDEKLKEKLLKNSRESLLINILFRWMFSSKLVEKLLWKIGKTNFKTFLKILSKTHPKTPYL